MLSDVSPSEYDSEERWEFGIGHCYESTMSKGAAASPVLGIATVQCIQCSCNSYSHHSRATITLPKLLPLLSARTI